MGSLNTIGSLIDHEHGLAAHCLNPRCRHYAEVDLTALAERLGRDHSSMHPDLTPRLICSACGGKKLALTLLAPLPGQKR